MALTNSNSNYIYLSVFNGKITRRVAEGTPGAIERENKNGKQVFELTYDNLSGRLLNIEFRDGDYGKEIHFVVADGIDKYRLQIPFSSPAAKGFISRFPNCNLKGIIEFRTGFDNEKSRTFSFLRQDGTTIHSAYTKDNPGDMPPMKKIKVKGQDVWDDSEQLEFLEKMLINDIMPQLKDNIVEGLGEVITPNTPTNPDPNDDLPF